MVLFWSVIVVLGIVLNTISLTLAVKKGDTPLLVMTHSTFLVLFCVQAVYLLYWGISTLTKFY